MPDLQRFRSLRETLTPFERSIFLLMVAWVLAIISLPLDPVPPPIQYKRIDLRIDRVWQPALYIAGSADMRRVGVQIGEPRLFRE